MKTSVELAIGHGALSISIAEAVGAGMSKAVSAIMARDGWGMRWAPDQAPFGSWPVHTREHIPN
jgi:hypothetical protein